MIASNGEEEGDERAEMLNRLKKELHTTVLAGKDPVDAETINEFYRADWRDKPIPFADFGFVNLDAFLSSLTDILRVTSMNGCVLYTAVSTDQTKHIVEELIHKTTPKEKKQNWSHFPRPPPPRRFQSYGGQSTSSSSSSSRYQRVVSVVPSADPQWISPSLITRTISCTPSMQSARTASIGDKLAFIYQQALSCSDEDDGGGFSLEEAIQLTDMDRVQLVAMISQFGTLLALRYFNDNWYIQAREMDEMTQNDSFTDDDFDLRCLREDDFIDCEIELNEYRMALEKWTTFQNTLEKVFLIYILRRRRRLDDLQRRASETEHCDALRRDIALVELRIIEIGRLLA